VADINNMNILSVALNWILFYFESRLHCDTFKMAAKLTLWIIEEQRSVKNVSSEWR